MLFSEEYYIGGFFVRVLAGFSPGAEPLPTIAAASKGGGLTTVTVTHSPYAVGYR